MTLPATPRRPVLILELAPKGGACRLRRRDRLHAGPVAGRFSVGPELAGVKTVAYIPRTIKGHGVLVALACEEIVMHPEAEIGEAGIDEDAARPIKPNIVRMYQQIAAARDTVPKAIALGMLDRAWKCSRWRPTRRASSCCATSSTSSSKNHTIVSPPETIMPAGSLGSFTGRAGPRVRRCRAARRTIARRCAAVWRCGRRPWSRISRWSAIGGP